MSAMNDLSHARLADVLAELPDELQSDAPREAGIAEIIASAGRAAPPIGRFSRFWTLGTMQGKIAAAYAFWWMRGMWQDADERQRHLNEAHLRNAVRLLGTMSTLRGAVMKVGQILAHWPGVAPEEFASVLGRLHFEAPPMHPALVREQIRAELGADPEQLFAEFDAEHAAAASLGQVHRAKLKGSLREVAVKVQYPGIARTIRDDIANLRLMLMPMRYGADGVNLTEQLDDIERMLAMETDYRAEAENLRAARATLAGLEDVVVPSPHADLSTQRILTMDWLDGVHLPALRAANPTQEERNRWGCLIARAGFRLGYRGRMLPADLHPGNFLFCRDGRLGYIDFGCVRHYSDDEYDYMAQAERASSSSRESIAQVVARAGDLTPRQQADPQRMALLTAWFDWVCEPTLTDEPYDFGNSDYISRGMEILRQLMRHRYARTLPVNNWVAKSFVGLRAMLAGLGAVVPLGKIMREESTVSASR